MIKFILLFIGITGAWALNGLSEAQRENHLAKMDYIDQVCLDATDSARGIYLDGNAEVMCGRLLEENNLDWNCDFDHTNCRLSAR